MRFRLLQAFVVPVAFTCIIASLWFMGLPDIARPNRCYVEFKISDVAPLDQTRQALVHGKFVDRRGRDLKGGSAIRQRSRANRMGIGTGANGALSFAASCNSFYEIDYLDGGCTKKIFLNSPCIEGELVPVQSAKRPSSTYLLRNFARLQRTARTTKKLFPNLTKPGIEAMTATAAGVSACPQFYEGLLNNKHVCDPFCEATNHLPDWIKDCKSKLREQELEMRVRIAVRLASRSLSQKTGQVPVCRKKIFELADADGNGGIDELELRRFYEHDLFAAARTCLPGYVGIALTKAGETLGLPKSFSELNSKYWEDLAGICAPGLKIEGEMRSAMEKAGMQKCLALFDANAMSCNIDSCLSRACEHNVCIGKEQTVRGIKDQCTSDVDCHDSSSNSSKSANSSSSSSGGASTSSSGVSYSSSSPRSSSTSSTFSYSGNSSSGGSGF